jgi:MFS transporter, DHA2 family, multidrug resistance protein
MILAVRAPARVAQIHPQVSVEVARAGLRPRLGILAVAMLCILADQSATVGFGTLTPFVRGVLAADVDAGAWLVIAGSAAYIAGVVATVRLLERFGRRTTILAAATGFALCTAVSGMTGDYTTFLVAHTVAQLFQGTTYVVGVVLMCAVFPRAFWAYTFILLSASSLTGQNLSPLLAGIAVDRATSAVFFVGTAVVLVGATVLAALVSPTDEPERKALPFDGRGLIAVAVTALCVEYLGVQGERFAWFDAPQIPLVVGAALVGSAIVVAWHVHLAGHPLVDWRVLLTHNHLVGDVLAGFNGFFTYGSTVLLAYAQTTLGFTPTLAGELLALRLVVLLAVVTATGVANAKRLVDPRITMGVALIVVAIAFWRISLETTSGSDLGTLVVDSLVLSLGLGALTQTVPGLVFGPIPDERVASATIFYKLFTIAGTLVATAAGSTLFDHRVAFWQSEFAGSVTLASAVVAGALEHEGPAQLASLVAQQASVAAYADEIRMFALAALLALPVVAFTRPAFRAKFSLGGPR